MPVTPKPDPASDFSLPRSHTLRLRTDFERIKALGKRQAGRHLVCNYMIRPREPRLAGFIVPKACGNAVARNKIKRRLREIYRHWQGKFPDGLQSVWIARRTAAGSELKSFTQDFEQIVKRCGFIGE
ncbi:MAG: ribonuclease P protein component [Blastochloris sp.]|nr:ribonuclease P protein component [Blastochloris sp.]